MTGNGLRMPTKRRPRCTLLFEAGSDDKSLAWVKSIEALASGMGRVGTIRLPGCRLRDPLLQNDGFKQLVIWLSIAVNGVLPLETLLLLLLYSSPTYYF